MGRSGWNRRARMIPPLYCHSCRGEGVWANAARELQAIRIRAAVKALTDDPASFSYTQFGYYDYSHFSKHLKQFVGHKYLKVFQSQLAGKRMTDDS